MRDSTDTTEVSKYEGYIRHVMEERKKNSILECDQHTLFVACELLNDKSRADAEWNRALLERIYRGVLHAELLENEDGSPAPGDHIGDFMLCSTANRGETEVPTVQ